MRHLNTFCGCEGWLLRSVQVFQKCSFARGRTAFSIEQEVAQGCSLSTILFSVFINGLLDAVEQAELGIELNNGLTIGGMLFADDFVGVCDSEEHLPMSYMLTVVNGG